MLTRRHLLAMLAASPLLRSAISTDRTEWYREAKFGMFIHWGPVALTGTKMAWSRGKEIPIEEYDQLYKRFNPTAFDAELEFYKDEQGHVSYAVLRQSGRETKALRK